MSSNAAALAFASGAQAGDAAVPDPGEDLRLALENVPVGTALLGLDGRWVRVNRALLEIVGRSEAELLGQSFQDITHPDDRDADLTQAGQLLKGRIDAYQIEKRYIRGDGTVVWTIVSGSLMRGDDGLPLYFVTQVQDISRRKAAEEALRHSEERLRNLAEGATDFVVYRIRFHPELVCEHVSSGALAITGHPAEAHYADPSLIYRSVHPEDLHLLEPSPDAEEMARPRVIRWVHPDGRVVWVSSRNTAILDDDGQVVGIEGMALDITAQREAEQSLRESEHRFRSMVQRSQDLFAVLDGEYNVSYMSPSVRSILGYAPDQLVGASGLDFIHPEDVLELAAAPAGQSAGGEAHPPIEFRMRHADGTWRWLEATSTNLLEDPVVRGLVVNARDVTERHAFQQELTHQSLHDALTGLPNRTLLSDRMERALGRLHAREGLLAVLLADVDRLRVINDSLGHEAGDEVLRVVAQRLTTCMDESDTLSRFSGDKFVLVVERMGSAQEALRFAEQVRSDVSRPLVLGANEVFPSLSIGVAVIEDGGASATEILREAEVAMYRAKTAGRGRVELFDGHLNDGTLARLQLEAELRRAVDEGQLRVVYQPVVSVADASVVGAEALVRWYHPDRGIVSPADFVPLAEETGLIVEIGAQVFEQAARQTVAWRAERPDLGDFVVAVNISVRQLRDPGVVETFRDIIARTGAAVADLSLEITESVLLDESPTVSATLTALKEMGLRLALDDFGTGYASLSALQRFPFDFLKIDRSFVSGIAQPGQERSIVAGIVNLARALGLPTIAEGVEDAAVFEELRRLGADHTQGFLFSRPVSAAEFPFVVTGGTR